MANNRRRNALVVPGADDFMTRFKNEIAAELGIANYDQIDKGALPARVHGMIGGSMTKRLIEMGEMYLSQQDPTKTDLDYQDYVRQMQEEVVGEAPHSYAAAPVVPIPEVAATQETTNLH